MTATAGATVTTTWQQTKICDRMLGGFTHCTKAKAGAVFCLTCLLMATRILTCKMLLRCCLIRCQGIVVCVPICIICMLLKRYLLKVVGLNLTPSLARHCPIFQRAVLVIVAGHTNPPKLGPSCIRATGISPVQHQQFPYTQILPKSNYCASNN